MKQLFYKRNKLFIVIFIASLSLHVFNAETIKSQEKDMNKRLRVDDYYESPVIIPSSHFHHNDHIHSTPSHAHYTSHPVTHILPLIGSQQQSIYPNNETCPCINEVKCPPCGVVMEQSSMCPCAPKLHCPVCPPLSLIHEIAAKKVD
jgi:hypothetical protein